MNPQGPRSLAGFFRLSHPRLWAIIPSRHCFLSANVGDCSSPDLEKGFCWVPDQRITERSRSNPLLKGGHHDILVVNLELHSKSP